MGAAHHGELRLARPLRLRNPPAGGRDGKDCLQCIVLDLGRGRLFHLHPQLCNVVQSSWRRHLDVHGSRLFILARRNDPVWP